MTFYELLDTRTNLLSRVDITFRFWVSITFAVIVAAYIAGPNLGLVAGIGIAALYGALTLGNIVAIRTEANMVLAILKSMQEAVLTSEEMPVALRDTDLSQGENLKHALMGIQVSGAFGTIAYLLYRLTGGT